MILSARTGRAAALGAALVVTAVTAVVVTGVPLRTDRSFGITSPRDGAVVGEEALFSWRPTQGASTYAVVVDAGLPRSGEAVSPSERVLTVTGTSMRMTLGRSRTGSPSARGFHTVTVLPLDDLGRRLGRLAAVVHVRNTA